MSICAAGVRRQNILACAEEMPCRPDDHDRLPQKPGMSDYFIGSYQHRVVVRSQPKLRVLVKPR